MNNDLYNKAVHLEEADGMINIGFPDPSPFGSPLPYGWINDFWFDNNSYYEEVNNSDDMIFNHASTPNSNTYSDLSSNISIEINSSINDNINVTVSFDSDTEHLHLAPNRWSIPHIHSHPHSKFPSGGLQVLLLQRIR